MSKLVKQLELDALTRTFKGVRDMVVLTADKIAAGIDYNVRKQLRDKKIKLVMVKNTLARKVFETNGITLDQKVWSGTTLVAFGADSIKDLSKAVDGFIKDVVKKDPKQANKYQVKAAVADGQTVSFDMAMKMPTRLEAIGEIIGMILGPASEIAGCLTGPASQVASQIATLADRKEDAPAAAPTA
jgi:large subunit ribosomal protein L10